MKKINPYLIIFIIFLINSSIKGQVYNKKVIYEYKYSIKNENNIIENGTIYLGCLGHKWALDKKQYTAIWTTDISWFIDIRITTGILETKDRIWLHPPRQGNFRILQYSPYPEIIKNINFWKRDLDIGKYWEEEKFHITGNESLEFIYEKKEIKNCEINFLNDNLVCQLIYSESKNINHRKTSFKGCFNEEFGFIEMTFKNIDGSIIQFVLTDIHDWDEFINVHFPFQYNN